MKSSRLPLFFAITLFLSTYTHALILDQAAIDKKAIAIERKMTRDRYIFYGLSGLSLAYQFSVLYKEWSKVGVVNAANPNSVSVDTVQVIAQKPINKEFFMVRFLKNMAYSFKSAGEYLLCTQDGWIATTQLFLGVASSHLISKMSEKLMHPDTLRWYVRSHAPYHVTIKLMKEQLVTLQDPSATQEQVNISSQLLDLLYDRLVHQAEAMCAYMSYKINRFDDEEKIVAQRAKEMALKSHNQFLERIAAKMYLHSAAKFDDKEKAVASLIDYTALNALLNEYKAILRTHSVHFAMIEGETHHDRSMIKDAQDDNQVHSSIQ